MTQGPNELLELFTDFSTAARKCTDELLAAIDSEAYVRAKRHRVRRQSHGIAKGDEILEMDICVEGSQFDVPSALREKMKTIMVDSLGKHFSALESGQHRAFKYLINSFLAHLAICELTAYQAKALFQTQSIEAELLADIKDRAEKIYAGSIKIAAEIMMGKEFNFFSMKILTGETEPFVFA